MSWPLNTWIAKRTATQRVMLNDRVDEALWHEAGHRSRGSELLLPRTVPNGRDDRRRGNSAIHLTDGSWPVPTFCHAAVP